VVTTVIAVLGLLVLVFELRSHHSTGYGAHDTVAAQLVPSKVPGSATSKGAHQASVALSLRVGVGGSIWLLALLSIWVLSVGVLVRWISALLRELVVRRCCGIRICSLRLAVLSGRNC
jgi:hypothetical protein